MSNTTLWHKLKEENTSYQTLLYQVREVLPRRYLHDTILPVTEVAELVGFDDRTNVRRAFRRWTGKTPSDILIHQAFHTLLINNRNVAVLLTNKALRLPIRQGAVNTLPGHT